MRAFGLALAKISYRMKVLRIARLVDRDKRGLGLLPDPPLALVSLSSPIGRDIGPQLYLIGPALARIYPSEMARTKPFTVRKVTPVQMPYSNL